MQICVGSGVPGNGRSALHRAHAQSPAGTAFVPRTAPSMPSNVAVVSVAAVVSRLTGGYGIGFE